MKILVLDIETAPSLAWVWSLWKQNIGLNQISKSGTVLCWAAKWLDEEHIYFDSVHRNDETAMLHNAHQLVSEADAVVTYNGKRFDIPTLNREWMRLGMAPPSPAKQIDLFETVKKRFNFLSRKLAYITEYLGLGEKVKHEGQDLWTKCMAGDKEAWKVMQEYNEQDVLLLEKLYLRMRPWVEQHPSRSAQLGIECCPKCGSEEFQQRGWAITSVHKYRRLQCNACGGWFRGNRTVHPRRSERVVNLVQ